MLLLLLVAFGCRRGNRWETQRCEVGSVSQQLAGEPLAQRVAKALQIFSFIPNSQARRLQRDADAGDLVELIRGIFQLLISACVCVCVCFSNLLSQRRLI